MYIQQPEKNGRVRHATDFAEDPALGRAISLQDLLRTIKKRFWVIVLVTALLVAAVLGYSLRATPAYQASTTILVGQNSGLIQNPGDVTGLQEVTRTMAQAVTSRPVAEAAVQELNLQIPPQELIGNLRAERVGETQFVRVTYTDTSPQRAQQVVNTVGEAFSEQVAKLQGQAVAATAEAYQQASADAFQQAGVTGSVPVVPPPTPTITATVWEQAEMPGAPASPNPRRDGLLALALGLMLGLGLAFLLERRAAAEDWRSPDEAEQVSGVPIIGIIPK